MTRNRKIACLMLLTSAAFAVPALAEGEANDGWSTKAEFAYVLTSGNSDTSTLGMSAKSVRAWDRSSLELNAQALNADSTRYTFVAVDANMDGTADGFTRLSDTETTAERYLFNARYDRKITDRFFWYTALGWDRNEPAGIKNRYTGVGGVGNIWRDDDTVKFRTDYAVTYTDQEDVITVPGANDSFVGARLSYDYSHKLTESTGFESTLVLDENLDETDDWRADFYNSVAVSMSDRLALKVGVRLLYDNLPSVESVDFPALAPGGMPATFLRELDEMDTIFTTSLVVTF